MPQFHYQHHHLAPEADFAREASTMLANTIIETIATHGRCILGLSGGSTPGPVYEALGTQEGIDWNAVFVFLVDDRYVSATSHDSNQYLLHNTLLKHAAIPAENIVLPDTTQDIAECVATYEERLRALMGPDHPHIVVLGLGPDGHIASLFPDDIDALLEQERWVLHTTTDTFAVHDRITLTQPVLTAAEQSYFLLRGDGKKKMFSAVLSSNMDSIEYPAHLVLEQGRSVWVTQW